MWNTCRTVAAAPSEILHVLTHEDAIRRWSPVDFELTGHAGGRLRSGDHARVQGRVAGISVGFDVEVAKAEGASLELFARGPVDIDVHYGIAEGEDGAQVEAAVDVRGGRGMTGRVVATTVRALLPPVPSTARSAGSPARPRASASRPRRRRPATSRWRSGSAPRAGAAQRLEKLRQ
jgi:hypothetical protein